ncbi:MAG: MBL fold metallo-hydrolase RNA specificity domain-containing protein, partial [Planctomycetota bacterium]|nr:MBL fold metallo-hydrolase RNA specificity domain-containing protein [Planctomycetota bacterium]
GEKEVRILGQKHRIKARVVRISGFSAHADRDELFKWLGALKKTPRKVFIVHGESESAQRFGDYINQKTGWQVVVPAYQDEIVLD